MPDKTIVVFRKWPKSEGGGIIALFPYDLGTNESYTCSSYEHVGQHGAADVGIIYRTKPATPEEYAALKHELESGPYNYVLGVRSRIPSDATERRRRQIAEVKETMTLAHETCEVCRYRPATHLRKKYANVCDECFALETRQMRPQRRKKQS